MSNTITVWVVKHIDLYEKPTKATGVVAGFPTEMAAVAAIREYKKADIRADWLDVDGNHSDELRDAWLTEHKASAPETLEDYEALWDQWIKDAFRYDFEEIPLHLEAVDIYGYNTLAGTQS